jgi:hypothetical protein
VGLGIYLPTSSTLMVVIGAIVGSLYDGRADKKSKNADGAKQLGVLLASGLIVGEGLIGVLNSAIVGFAVQIESAIRAVFPSFAFSNKDFPLSLVSDTFAGSSTPMWIGGIAFVTIVALLYGWLMSLTRKIEQ